MLRFNLVTRRFISTSELATLLRSTHPHEDPRVLRESKVKTLASSVMKSQFPYATTGLVGVSISEVHQKWKSMFERAAHDLAYEEAADPGEQCDGELNSWRNDRLRAEKDRSCDVPQVSAHEAATRLKQAK